MKVAQVSLLYEKHKAFGWRQGTKKNLTEKNFNSLALVNLKNKLSYTSCLSQLNIVVGSMEFGHTNMQEVLSQISEKYVRFDEELKEQVKEVMNCLHLENSYSCIKELTN